MKSRLALLSLALLFGIVPTRGLSPADPRPGAMRELEAEVIGEETVIFVVEPTDGTRVEVAREPFARMPLPMFRKFMALSPNGRRVAYVTADNLAMRNARLWLVGADGGQRRLLAAFPRDFWVAPLVWAPDNGQIAVVKRGRPDELELWTVNAGTGAQRRVPRIGPIDPELFYGADESVLDWSVDGLALKSGEISSPESYMILPCPVPLFAQNDPAWSNVMMETCGLTIGEAGCALTSAAMILGYYGTDTDPFALNACLGSYACPLYWYQAAALCSNSRAACTGSHPFSWAELERQVALGRPVILGMVRSWSHYVVVIAGTGSTPGGYAVHDPWDAQVRSLADFSAWSMTQVVTYDGTPACTIQRLFLPLILKPVTTRDPA